MRVENYVVLTVGDHLGSGIISGRCTDLITLKFTGAKYMVSPSFFFYFYLDHD